jgi:pimeloyl-ACP methyl ester carboxylesterase
VFGAVPDLSELAVQANGIRFECLAAGEPDAPLALCLHGFPDSAWTWRHLLPELAEAGFRAVAPWMRGYAPTGLAPDGRYQAGALAADAVALHQAMGGDSRAVAIGHDWGALAAYGAGALRPELWTKVVTAALPPVPATAAGFFSYDQLRRSWYIFYFQSPLADAMVAMNDLEFIDRLWADWSPGYEAKADAGHAKDALRDPANLEAALAYYRTLFDADRQAPELAAEQAAASTVPPQPTLYLHGSDDGCMGAEVGAGTGAWLSPGSSTALIDGTGHFLHLEQPAEVNARIIDFLRK